MFIKASAALGDVGVCRWQLLCFHSLQCQLLESSNEAATFTVQPSKPAGYMLLFVIVHVKLLIFISQIYHLNVSMVLSVNLVFMLFFVLVCHPSVDKSDFCEKNVSL